MKIEEGKFYRTRDGRKAGPATAIIDDDSQVMDVPVETPVRNHVWIETGTRSKLEERPEPTDLVAGWNAGPVRTVTRREIVPGQYGVVEIDKDSRVTDEGVSLWLPRNHRYSPAELRATAATLTEIADALESQP